MYRSGLRGFLPAVLVATLLLVSLGTVAESEVPEAEPGVDVSILRVGLPLEFHGEAVATTEEGLLHIALDEAEDSFLFRLEATSAKVDLHTVTRTSGVLDDRTGQLERLGLGDTEEIDVARYGPFSDAWVSLDGAPRDAYFVAHLAAARDARFTSEGLAGVSHLDDVRKKTQISYRDSPGAHDDSHNIHPGHFTFNGESPATTIVGDFRLVIHGIDFRLGHEDGQLDLHTGTSSMSSAAPAPPGVQAPGAQESTQYAVLTLAGARLLVASDTPQVLYAPSGAMEIAVDGSMESPGLAGGIRIGSDVVETAGDAAQMSGTFRVTPTGSGNGNAVMRLEGDVDTLTVGPQQYTATKDAVAKTAGVMVLLAGAAAVAWHVGKSGVIFPLYAKLTRRKVLDQGTRNLVYLKVQEDPGVTTKTIAETLDVSWSTAAYHLRVLRHMGLVTARRRGRHEHHFVAGERSLGDQEIMAVLRHPTTRNIARLVTREPGIIQKEICARLGIAPSTASDHLRRLRELGALREVQEWRTRSYHPGEALQRMTEADPAAAAAPAPLQAIVPALAAPTSHA